MAGCESSSTLHAFVESQSIEESSMLLQHTLERTHPFRLRPADANPTERGMLRSRMGKLLADQALVLSAQLLSMQEFVLCWLLLIALFTAIAVCFL